MDFVHKAYSQVVELFQSMTAGARISAALLLAVVVISLAYLFQYRTSGGDEYLFGGQAFAQRELATMETAFARSGLNQSEIVGNRMRVPRGQRDLYLAALADHQALPENFDTEFEKLIGSESPFVSRQLRDIRLKHASQKKLGRIVSSMKGIEDAAVQYDEVKLPGFPPRVEKRAVVAVRSAGNRPLDEERVRAIRDTVAAGGGLEREHVTVTDLNNGRAYSGGGEDGLPAAGENLYATHKKVYETYWRDAVYQRLSMYPGIVIGVNVELEPEMNHHSHQTSYDTQPVPLVSSDFRRETTSQPADNGGQPGFVPNVGNTPMALSNPAAQRSESSESRAEQKSITGQTEVRTHRAPLIPERVTASIGIPHSYFVKVWHQRNPAVDGEPPGVPEPEQLQQIEEETRADVEQAVLALLPPDRAGADAAGQVIVTAYHDLPSPALDEPGLSEHALSWLAGNWQTLGMLGIGLLSLLGLRALIRSPQTASPAPLAQGSGATGAAPPARAGKPDEENNAEGTEGKHEEEATVALSRLRSRSPDAAPSLRDELSTLVKQDPDAAANVLRNWIGDAA